MTNYLQGVKYIHIYGNIYEIHIKGYGPADVGPYLELKRHVGVNSGLECHHIVETEHLLMVQPSYSKFNAPAVAIPATLHRQVISPRITAALNSYAGRYGGKVVLTKKELLELYKNVYEWHTSFQELYVIAKNILT